MKHKIPAIEKLMNRSFFMAKDATMAIKQLEKLHQSPSLTSQSEGNVLFFKQQQNMYCYSVTQWQPTQVPQKTYSVQINQSLENILPLFHKCPYILVEDGAAPVGYLDAAELLNALHRTHSYLDAYFEAMIETMEASVTMIDEDEKTIVWSRGAEHIFSIPAQKIIGQSISDFFPIDMLQTLKTLKTGESVLRKQHQPRPDLYVLINANPIRLNGRIIGSVATEMNITSEVRLNQELFNATAKVLHLQQQMAQLRPSSDPFVHIKGSSRAIKQTIDMCKKIGSTKATALILGESGVGKELFAKAIHDIREKSSSPFIAINCGAIPPSLFESELFGYERGAFSGADVHGKKGKIELARGGTLFLDEIGEMPIDMQVKLLRVLQERKYYPVGGTKQLDADFRVIAATNRDLEDMVKLGQFREDLYYRLNVVTVEIPPLRKRKEDIIELTQTFLYEFALSYNRVIHEMPQNVVLSLMQYDWPGNIRELRNTIERLVVFAADGQVKQEYLPTSIFSSNYEQEAVAKLAPLLEQKQEEEPAYEIQSLQKELDTYEKSIILRTLNLEKDNKVSTAKRLGMSRATLYNKMNKLGLLET